MLYAINYIIKNSNYYNRNKVNLLCPHQIVFQKRLIKMSLNPVKLAIKNLQKKIYIRNIII
jgi:hypothetical protein